jgi:pimeloyl-ACP methyl ester carboxylesterase
MVHPSRRADEALIDAIVDMFGRKTADTFAAQIQALLARPDATPLLGTIRCPALVLCGREDSWAPLARHEAMAAALPGGTLAVIENCGHMAPMERPGEVAAALAEWLARVADASRAAA